MKGDPKVLEVLNEALGEELTAINQYFLHSEICENLGYSRLQQAIKAESIDEMKHAEALIERILLLEGQPNMSRYGEIRVGKEVDDMLANDLELEKGARELYNRAIRICVEAGDMGTREVMEKILADEERHLDWLETQHSLIRQLGLVNYLARQIHS